jgi:NADH-quinone oxidoreductase subunit M
MSALLLATIFLPLVGVAIIALLAPFGAAIVRQSALLTAVITLVMAAVLIVGFMQSCESSPESCANFAGIDVPWLGGHSLVNIQFSVGLDGLSVWLFGLSALLTLTSVLISWDSIRERPAAFFAMLLLLETGMLGVFVARDIILFYVFFEFTLIPLFFLIGVWGSEERRHAAMKFFIFTFAGSVLTFLGLLTIVLWQYSNSPTHELTFSIPRLTEMLAARPLPNDAAHGHLQMIVFLALFAGFAIKVPLFPLHTWLPLAHTQAPAAGSVLLAGILLKIGAYGFLRFSLPMLPEAAAICIPWLLWLAVIGIVYGALLALAQADMKRLIACSSVSHLGFCMLGVFALNTVAVQGGVLQMINHGLSTGALFALIGMLYERYHTRAIADLGGIARRMPRLTFFMLLFTFSSIGLPGLNGFAGEFPILLGMFQRGCAQAPAALGWQLLVIAVLAVSGVVLGAWYMLWLVQRVFFGSLREPGGQGAANIRAQHETPHYTDAASHGGQAPVLEAPIVEATGDHPVRDMNFREVLALVPIAVFVFWIGLVPGVFLKPIAPAVEQVTTTVGERFERQYAGETASAARPAALASQASIDKAGASRR